MIKILYGVQNELIENYIKNFIKKNKIDNIIKYDYSSTNIESVIEECLYPDLFGSSKLVILYNCDFLTSKGKLESKIFDKFILNNSENSNLFLITDISSLDERKKIIKTIRNIHEVIEFNKFSEYDAIKYVSNYFSNIEYKIDSNATKKIVEYLSTNFGLYDGELKKLEIYKINEKKINIEDVIKLTSRIPEDDVFKLWDAIIDNNKERIFDLYKSIKTYGMDEISLLGLFSSQFRFMYQVTILVENGKTKNDIVSLLSSHPYKTELAIKKVGSIKKERILDILYDLALYDIKIKSGELDKLNVIEDFFLNL